MTGSVGVETVPPRTWPEPSSGGLRSAVYEGTVAHRRYGPGPSHSFSYAVTLPLLDLAEVESVSAMHPLWSATRAAPVRFRRADFLGRPDVPLDQAVRDLVADRTGHRPAGPVGLLANLRTWGWLFNPISLYFCAADDDDGVATLVAEVQNTPWHERISYVVGGPGEHRFAKGLHVSPFLPMDLTYRLEYTDPGARMVVVIDVLEGEDRVFGARMDLRRREIDRRALGTILWHSPAMTHRVSAGIYAQAARLGLKGAPFFPHPGRRP